MNIWKIWGYLTVLQKVLCPAVFLKIEDFISGSSCVQGGIFGQRGYFV